jgi:hypothetical protein
MWQPGNVREPRHVLSGHSPEKDIGMNRFLALDQQENARTDLCPTLVLYRTICRQVEVSRLFVISVAKPPLFGHMKAALEQFARNYPLEGVP